MYRDMALLAAREHDVIVIGGGIYGACVAWDAALRGLSVALVDKGDFGNATSANSLKTIHGGLRYLQDANLLRMRLMIRQRRTWLRIAPHLVRPLTCILPTGGKLTRHKLTMTVALAVNDLISLDRNRGVFPEQHLPNGRILSRAECLQYVPGLSAAEVSGGALWYDAQLLNSERLLLSVLHSAVDHGAAIANYAQVIELKQDGRRLCGVVARDLLNGRTYTLSGRLIVNCAGAWTDSVLAMLNDYKAARTFHLSTAMNLVTRQILPDVALGLPIRSAGSERILFIAPWHRYSLVGTWHNLYTGHKPEYRVDETTIQGCLDEINAAYPVASLTRDDVYHVQVGYLPAHPTAIEDHVKLVRESAVHDHSAMGGPEGLITVVGVKYTTALNTAAQAVDLALRKLDRPHIQSRMGRTPVAGADDLAQSNELRQNWAADHRAGLQPEALEHLVQNYGTATGHMLAHLAEEPGWGERVAPSESVLGVEVIHGVRCEMAQTLADVMQRRTQLGAVGAPDREVATTCARLMAGELGWSIERQAAEIEALYASYEFCPNPRTGNF
jgi:glycerol-3-phosphate dehydrogenase